ncbi:MAG TPA: class I SAM-dependent methyltransferase, partial [Candidatus Acidoferrales bacterium]|nr:class I SAM-dependent methyltransferase [Candidatus Acidoferrales bacterium]
MTEWRVENWLSDSPHRAIEYSEYWNDEQNEQDKAWNILDGDFTKMESYLAQIGLVEDLRECLDACRARRGSGLGGVGIDLAAGNLWAAPHLLGSGDIEKLYCLEFSKHRLLKLGPKVLEHYQVPNDKVVLVYGSFYDLHLADGSVDFALLSAAFHHAEDPNRLLSEIRRVLKPDGVLMVIGEHIVPEPYSLGYLKVCAKHVAKAVIAASTPA